jgi:DNA-binding MarR family transcriptional regulator
MKMRALRVIWSSDEATAQDIVSTIKRDKAQVARLVEDLCEQNLVERRMNPNDKRSKLLRLTDCGRDIFNKVEQIEQSFANELIEGIPKEELEVFFGVADKLSENMKSMN